MCSNYRYKAHNTSYESHWSLLYIEPKKQAQTSRLLPPTLPKLSAVGWSGSARFGARLRTKALFWGNRGRNSLMITKTYTNCNLAAPITRHRHYQSIFRCTIHYPDSTNQLISGLKLELPAAKTHCDCADCLPQS